MILTRKVFQLTGYFFNSQQLWVPAPKKILKEIRSLKPEFYDLLSEFYQEGTSIRFRLAAVKKMYKMLFS